MNAAAKETCIRRCFAAYQAGDRAAIEQLLSADFEFTSPYDDHIDRAAYFERCWPAGKFIRFDLHHVDIDGEHGFAHYDGTSVQGATFRNVELFRFDGELIRSVEVFFGRPAHTASASADREIRELVAEQARAIRTKDARAVMALNAPDIVTFGLVAPLRQRGAEAVRKHLQEWFDVFDGGIECELRELDVSTADNIGFCHFLQRFGGTNTHGDTIDMWVRATLGLRRSDGHWLIVHEHISDPIDPVSGKGLTALKP